jgi:hypothetical protein
MIRESLTGGSRHAFTAVTPGNGLAFQGRVTTGGASFTTAGPSGTAPYWVRIVRAGSTFTSYSSTTGTSWTATGSATISMAASVYIGLAVTSHNVAVLTTATLSNVVVTSGSSTPPPSNVPPSVSVTAPASGATFTAPANINIAASASDSDGTVASVTFYAGATPIGLGDVTSPYGVTWSNVPAGAYSLTAVAVDNQGASRTSAAVSITVTASGSLVRQLIFTASSNHSTSVTSYRMDFFATGATSPVRSQDLGKPTPVNGDITVDIATLVQGLPAGTYYITVTAIGAGGTAQSSPSPTFSR